MPSFSSEAEIDLSVVIPAYNEIERLPTMIEECVNSLSTAKRQTWPFIILNLLKLFKTTNLLDFIVTV